MTRIDILGCLPCSAFPLPPDDQPGAKKQKCPTCHEEMWVSHKKRKLHKTRKYPLLCWICVLGKCRKIGAKLEVSKIEDLL